MPAVFILAGIVLIFAFMALAVFARGGAIETSRDGARLYSVKDKDELEWLMRRLVDRNHLRIERRDADEDHGLGIMAIDPTQPNSRRVYLRGFLFEEGVRARGVDVQNTIDGARDEAVNELLLVSPTGFTDDAVLASRGTTVQLIDGDALYRMFQEDPSTASSPHSPHPA